MAELAPLWVVSALAWLVLVLSLVAAGVWFAIHEAQKIPAFYGELLATDMASAEEQGKQFERNLVRLQNSARLNRPWKVEITQDQVNGWFASDMREKFPDSVPREIVDPRIVFDQQETKLAFQYQGSGLFGVVVIRGNVFCTEQPNEIAFEVKDVRAGIVPLPVGPWIEKVASSIRDAGIPLYWSSAGDSPIGVFTIPDNLSRRGDNRHVVIQAIDLLPGKLVIAGTTEPTLAETTREEGAPEGGRAAPSDWPQPAAETPPVAPTNGDRPQPAGLPQSGMK